VRRFRDGKLGAFAERSHARQQGEVAVQVDQAESSAADHGGFGEVEVNPPQTQCDHETEAGDHPRLDRELDRGHRDDRFAKHNDDERAEALGEGERMTVCSLSTAHARMGIARSMAIATAHGAYRNDLGTKIDTSQNPVVAE
jgi:hypothetical protein